MVAALKIIEKFENNRKKNITGTPVTSCKPSMPPSMVNLNLI